MLFFLLAKTFIEREHLAITQDLPN